MAPTPPVRLIDTHRHAGTDQQGQAELQFSLHRRQLFSVVRIAERRQVHGQQDVDLRVLLHEAPQQIPLIRTPRLRSSDELIRVHHTLLKVIGRSRLTGQERPYSELLRPHLVPAAQALENAVANDSQLPALIAVRRRTAGRRRNHRLGLRLDSDVNPALALAEFKWPILMDDFDCG